MTSEKGRPLPKFGEWDVNNPASAEGFTVIFNKARDEKKTSGATAAQGPPRRHDGLKSDPPYQYQKKKKVALLGLNAADATNGHFGALKFELPGQRTDALGIIAN